MLVQPESYNEYGEIVEKQEPPVVYERRLDIGQEHRIHQTKDLFDSGCTLCQEYSKKFNSYWSDDE